MKVCFITLILDYYCKDHAMRHRFIIFYTEKVFVLQKNNAQLYCIVIVFHFYKNDNFMFHFKSCKYVLSTNNNVCVHCVFLYQPLPLKQIITDVFYNICKESRRPDLQFSTYRLEKIYCP